MTLLFMIIYSLMLSVDGVPKLGHENFDPLVYESNKDTMYEYQTFPYPEDRFNFNEFQGPDEDDFLENNMADSATPVIADVSLPATEATSKLTISNLETTITTTTSTTPTQPETSSVLIQKLLKINEPLTRPLTDSNPTVQTQSTHNLQANDKTVAIARSSCTSCSLNAPNKISKSFRRQDSPSNRMSGYDYDENSCKMINNRILCGYNKNQGVIADELATATYSGDCVTRDERIECGYAPGGNKGQPAALRMGPTSKVLQGKMIVLAKAKQKTGVDPVSNDTPKTKLRGEALIFDNGMIATDEPSEPLVLSTPNNDTLLTSTSNVNSSVTFPDAIQALNSEGKQESPSATLELTKDYNILITSQNDDNFTQIVDDSNKNEIVFQDKPALRSDPMAVDTDNETASSEFSDKGDGFQSNTDLETDSNNENNQAQPALNVMRKDNDEHVDRVTEPTFQHVTRCVEIGDRIVCYNIKVRDVTPHM